MVGSEVRLLTAAVVPVKAKQIVNSIFVVRSQWGRAKPAVEVETRWRSTVSDGFFGSVNPVGARQRNIYRFDFAKSS